MENHIPRGKSTIFNRYVELPEGRWLRHFMVLVWPTHSRWFETQGDTAPLVGYSGMLLTATAPGYD